MNPRVLTLVSTVFIVAIFLTMPVFGQNIVIPPDQLPATSEKYFVPLTIESERVDVLVRDNIAEVTSKIVIRNLTSGVLEGTFLFPIPYGANVSGFALTIDGKTFKAEVLQAEQARRIYEEIVRTMRDPGLLQYVGQGLVRASVYPIPANGTREVKISYQQLLDIEDGMMRLDFPLKTDGFSALRIGSLVINVEIDVPGELGLVYSPSHTVDINIHEGGSANVSYEGSNIIPQGDFTLFMGRPDRRVGANIVTHATSASEGFFLAMIAPEYKRVTSKEVSKDFIFVVDHSGSMSGDKIEQAKQAMEFIFRNLNEGDNYSLITFSTTVTPYASGWKKYEPGKERGVIDFIRSLQSTDYTYIEGAIKAAFDLKPREGVPCYIIFLTDGLPTEGETDTTKLLALARKLNTDNRRIFGFGVGWDLDYQFLDLLARENGGYTMSVEPGENLEAPLADFYSKIKSPILSNVKVRFDGPTLSDVYPRELPDLFLGSQIVLAGKYRGGGEGCLYVSGDVEGKRVEFEFDVDFKGGKNDFIPRLWANRKVGFLLNEIRLHGENEEIVAEIIALAKRYGIVTAYTSMLVVEEGEFENEGQAEAFNRMNDPMLSMDDKDLFKSGKTAQQASKSMQGQENIANAEESYNEEITDTVRYAGDKTFYLDEDGFWVDSEFDSEEFEPEEIEYLSDEYFDLIDEISDLAEYLSVGEQVIVVFDDVAYKIVSEDE